MSLHINKSTERIVFSDDDQIVRRCLTLTFFFSFVQQQQQQQQRYRAHVPESSKVLSKKHDDIITTTSNLTLPAPPPMIKSESWTSQASRGGDDDDDDDVMTDFTLSVRESPGNEAMDRIAINRCESDLIHEEIGRGEKSRLESLLFQQTYSITLSIMNFYFSPLLYLSLPPQLTHYEEEE